MPSSTSLSLSLRPSSSSSALGATSTLCPVEPGTGSQRSDSGTESNMASFGSTSESPVNSRLACSQSDFDTSGAERPLMTASSTARSCTIFRVTVPMPWEFSAKVPCFKGLVFISQKLPRMKGLIVVRSFHFARAAILARITGFGKNVLPFWRLWVRIGGLGNRTKLVEGFRINGRLHDGREWSDGSFHKVRCRLLVSVTMDLLRCWFNSPTDRSLQCHDFRAIDSSHPPK